MASLAAGATQELICAGVNVAGGITDAVISKEYAGIITSVLTAGGGLAINHTIGKSLFPGKKSEDGAGPENTGTDGTTPTTDGTPDAETTPDAAKAPKEDKPKDLAACVVYRPFNRPFPLRRPGSQGFLSRICATEPGGIVRPREG